MWAIFISVGLSMLLHKISKASTVEMFCFHPLKWIGWAAHCFFVAVCILWYECIYWDLVCKVAAFVFELLQWWYFYLDCCVLWTQLLFFASLRMSLYMYGLVWADFSLGVLLLLSYFLCVVVYILWEGFFVLLCFGFCRFVLGWASTVVFCFAVLNWQSSLFFLFFFCLVIVAIMSLNSSVFVWFLFSLCHRGLWLPNLFWRYFFKEFCIVLHEVKRELFEFFVTDR